MRFTDCAANHILASLPEEDFARLEKYLTIVSLPAGTVLQGAGETIENVYFPLEGLVSVVAGVGTNRQTEVGMIGFDGFCGHTAAFVDGRSLLSMHMLIAGSGLRISAQDLRAQMRCDGSLRETLGRFLAAFGVQTAYTALANSDGNIAERLARWILMAHDRGRGDNIAITHDAVSKAMGVRRPGVTTALRDFVARGVIRTGRSALQVRDRTGLQACAAGLYGPTEKEQALLTGWHAGRPLRAVVAGAGADGPSSLAGGTLP